MGQLTKVKKDSHGLYVRAGGYLFRPVFPAGYNHTDNATNIIKEGSKFKEGDAVKARHIGGSPKGSIKTEHFSEFWHSHGTYKDKNSEEVWMPAYESWDHYSA